MYEFHVRKLLSGQYFFYMWKMQVGKEISNTCIKRDQGCLIIHFFHCTHFFLLNDFFVVVLLTRYFMLQTIKLLDSLEELRNLQPRYYYLYQTISLVRQSRDRPTTAQVNAVTTIHKALVRWGLRRRGVSFSSRQRNLIKTFQIKGMIALITKMHLVFS